MIHFVFIAHVENVNVIYTVLFNTVDDSLTN